MSKNGITGKPTFIFSKLKILNAFVIKADLLRKHRNKKKRCIERKKVIKCIKQNIPFRDLRLKETLLK